MASFNYLCIIFVPIITSILMTQITFAALNLNYANQASNLRARLSLIEESFEGHDIAKVHIREGQGYGQKRRLVKREASEDLHKVSQGNDGQSVLELELSSGSKVDLDLQPAGIIDSDTVLSFYSELGSIDIKEKLSDCYFYGRLGDSTGKGLAAVSSCDGLFGFASSERYDYFIHPVDDDDADDDDVDDNDVDDGAGNGDDDNVDESSKDDNDDDDDVDESSNDGDDDDDDGAGDDESKDGETNSHAVASIEEDDDDDNDTQFDNGSLQDKVDSIDDDEEMDEELIEEDTDNHIDDDEEDSTVVATRNVAYDDDNLQDDNKKVDDGHYNVVKNRKRRATKPKNEVYDVHIFWRKKESGRKNKNKNRNKRRNKNRNKNKKSKKSTQDVNLSPTIPNEDDVIIPISDTIPKELKVGDENRLNTSKLVIELAMFSDANYCKQLQQKYPGREHDFLLTRMAGAQALYSNQEKVGYNVQIKLKHLEFWYTDPEGYNFTQKLSSNLRSFCKHTRRKHFYDVHALNTGVSSYNKGVVGLAYAGGACTRRRCLVTKGTAMKTFVLYAHEIAHTLGIAHQNVAKCPDHTKSEGGFMGGGDTYNFSPCMKHQLKRFVAEKKSNCLFKETGHTTTTNNFTDLPNVLPGQFHTPNRWCQIFAGHDYKYVPLWKSYGWPVCQWMVCLNENKTSPEYGRARRYDAPEGFPCNHESFCGRKQECQHWDNYTMSLEAHELRNMTKIPEWSEWSSEVTPCSRSCGTGVKTRTRKCLYSGFHLSPYCPGSHVEAELCNTDPCPKDPTNKKKIWQIRGNEVCKRFLHNEVKLDLKSSQLYRPIANNVMTRDAGARVNLIHSKTCLIKCRRNRPKMPGDLDAFMPDGTPCFDYKRKQTDYEKFNIELRCVRGSCREFSDCPDKSQEKNECGACWNSGEGCVEMTFNDTVVNVGRRQRATLTSIPAGSNHVEVKMNWNENKGVILELWGDDDDCVIGRNCEHPYSGYANEKAISFAGTRWSYQRRGSFLTADGPTNKTVEIKVFRQRNPVKRVTVNYAKGPATL